VNQDLIDLLLIVLAMATALGLSTYAALAVPGIAASVGLITVPDTLTGLSAPAVWGTLLGLLAIEWLAARHRLADLAWNVLHLLVKPQAAFLLAALALSNAATATQWVTAFVASALATLVHVSVLAVHAAARTAGPSPRTVTVPSLQWVTAAGLATFAIAAPPLAGAVAAMVLVAPLPWLPQFWGAARLPLATAYCALTRPDQSRSWDKGLEPLPVRLRGAVESEYGAAVKSVKSTPATLARLGSERPFCRGRLVVAPDRPPLFAHRRGFRPRIIQLGAGSADTDGGLFVETVATDAAIPYALCLGPDSAPVSAILAAVEEEPAAVPRNPDRPSV
jgi:hypothetical protein